MRRTHAGTCTEFWRTRGCCDYIYTQRRCFRGSQVLKRDPSIAKGDPSSSRRAPLSARLRLASTTMMPRGRGRGAPIPASPVNARAAGRGASPLAPATPHSARFESAAVAATPSATPPLPKDGLSALVVRLAAIHVGKDALLPARKDVAKFKAEDVRQKLTAHLEEHHKR